MITAPLYTIPYLIFSVPCPLSPLTFLYFSSSLSSHLSCLHLSFCRLSSHHFFSLFTFVSHISALFILCCLVHCVALFTFSTSLILPPFLPRFYPDSLLPLLLLHVKYLLSILFFTYSPSLSFLFTYLSLFLPVCFSVKRSVLGLFTYSPSLLPQRYANPLLSLRTV